MSSDAKEGMKESKPRGGGATSLKEEKPDK
jgi:hypothetical protein